MIGGFYYFKQVYRKRIKRAFFFNIVLSETEFRLSEDTNKIKRFCLYFLNFSQFYGLASIQTIILALYNHVVNSL